MGEILDWPRQHIGIRGGCAAEPETDDDQRGSEPQAASREAPSRRVPGWLAVSGRDADRGDGAIERCHCCNLPGQLTGSSWSGQVSKPVCQGKHLLRGMRGQGLPIKEQGQQRLVWLMAEPAREGEPRHLV